MKIIHDAFAIMTPFLLAAAGGLFTELAGSLSIALEGFMLIGAFTGIIAAHVSGSLAAGLAAGMFFAVLFASLYGFAAYFLKADIFIAGLAANLLAAGLTSVISGRFFGTKGVLRFDNIPGLKTVKLPLIGGYSVMVYLSWIFLVFSWYILFRTPFGMRVRSTGYDEETVRSLGLRPGLYRLISVLIAGAACGAAGAMLSLNVSAFVPGITAGRGWIALVVIYLGNRSFAGIFAASFVFGLSISLSNYAQGVVSIPPDFILAFPYVLTVTVMVVYSVWHKRKRAGERG